MKSFHNMLVVQTFINELMHHAFQILFIKQTEKSLPKFILVNLNSALQEASIYQLTDNDSLTLSNPIPYINDHQTIKVDNRTPFECKSYQRLATPLKSIRKGHSRYTKTVSMKSQNLESQQDLTVSRQQSTKKDQKYRAKNVSTSLIKLYPQSKEQMQKFQNQEKLRQQLLMKKQDLQKATQNLLRPKRKISQKNENIKNQLNDLKNFTFHYDSTIIKSKLKTTEFRGRADQVKENNLSEFKMKAFEEISELESNVEKHQILSKKKKSISQHSMPQIVQNSYQLKRGVPNSEKIKSYHQQIRINDERSKSVIEMINQKGKVQKGVVIKETIDGKSEQLKKDSIKIERKMRELSKKEFQNSFAKKKFISRIQKSLNEI